MVCVYCGSSTQVINSRLQKRPNQVWRRRACVTCGNTFTTHEKADLESSWVVRYSPKDIRPFQRDALFISLYESCKHRPTALTDADGLTQTIVAALRPSITEGSVTRADIVEKALEILQRFDTVAATMYAAYHSK